MKKFLILSTILLSGCMQNDKAMHVVAGAAISSIVYQETKNHVAACASALAAGVLKEAVDSRTHSPDPADAFATAIGCSVTFVF